MGDLMDLTKREKTGLYVFGAIILILISYMYFSNKDKGEIEVNSSLTPTAESTSAPSEETGEIRAYICGAVCKPGVYTLLEGDRVDILLAMAGGATGEADLSAINLAERLQDEQYVWVPSKGEEGVPSREGATPSASKAGASLPQSQGLVNINTASAEELDSLPGIGPAIASRIIAYREEKGKFTSIEQIKEVSGIGESKYADLKDRICVK
jgi:competence protein ComEA